MASRELCMKRKPRNVKNLGRKLASMDVSKRILIVCEGKKTEPNYFKHIVDVLKLSSANIEITGDCDPSPDQVYRAAQSLYKKSQKSNNPYDVVYCVFDRDKHTTYNDTLNKIKNEARSKNVFEAITSDPCFEYWYLLHFQYTTKPFESTGHKSRGDCVIDDLKKHIPDYDKACTGYFIHLKGKLKTALNNALKVRKQNKELGGHPTTKVDILVDTLISEAKMEKAEALRLL